MRGLPWEDPKCIHSVGELTDYINRVGFLPLFKNGIPGFSVEEHTAPEYWWSGDKERDPWEWRGIIAAQGEIAYGKFFDKKAGFISKDWLPVFANARRNGYDFDSLWEEGLAPVREKRVMDAVLTEGEIFSNELRCKAGFSKGGEKNFEGVMTALQMQTYLCVRDFRQRLNKKGAPYGWALAVYCAPERIWGYEHVTGAYAETPSLSRDRIVERVRKLYPDAPEKELKML